MVGSKKVNSKAKAPAAKKEKGLWEKIKGVFSKK